MFVYRKPASIQSNGWKKVLPCVYGGMRARVNENCPVFAMRAVGVCIRPTLPQSLAVTIGLRDRAAEDGARFSGVSPDAAPPALACRSGDGPCVARNEINPYET